MPEDIGAVAGDIDDLLASHVLDAEARRRLTEIRDKLEEVASSGRRRKRSSPSAERGPRGVEG